MGWPDFRAKASGPTKGIVMGRDSMMAVNLVVVFDSAIV
jgi:hypothetical protein